MEILCGRYRIIYMIRAMGKQGFRRPGSMIAKLVDDEIKKIAKKQGLSYQKMKENLLKRRKAASEW